MLIELVVRDLALFDDVRVPFGPRLNVVTGETGAGKSVLVEAIRLALGEKADPLAVRSGEAEAEVCALFDLSGRKDLREVWEEAGLPWEEEVILRRVIPASGRSRAYLNGRPVPQSALAELSPRLVEMVSQHSAPLLLSRAAALSVLDEFAGCTEEAARMRASFRRLSALRRAAADAGARAASAASAAASLDASIAEIEGASLAPDEEERIAAELSAVRNVVRLGEALRGAEAALSSEERSAAAALAFAAARLREAAAVDPRLAGLAERARNLQAEANELVREVAAHASRLFVPPDRRERLEERLSEIRRLKRRYGKEVPDLVAHLDVLRAERARLDGALEEARRLRAEVEAEERAAAAAARALGAVRRAAAQRLGPAVEAELGRMDLPGARFAAQVTARGDGPDDLSASGFDEAEFLFSANPGQDLRPLAQTASGGELSRVMLALRNAAARGAARRTMVFDEIDAGIGGRTAERVGARLRDLAAGAQVICVTHLAQVAAFAQHHILVGKRAAGAGVTTWVKALGKEDRIEELARMISGAEVTDRARRHARDLLEKAGGE